MFKRRLIASVSALMLLAGAGVAHALCIECLPAASPPAATDSVPCEQAHANTRYCTIGQLAAAMAASGGSILGSASTPWSGLYLNNPGADGTAGTGGLSFGPDMLSGYILSARGGDLALAGVPDGTTCREVDVGTGGDRTAGVGNIIERLNVRGCVFGVAAPQGSAPINAFEMFTFPYETLCRPSTLDCVYPGLGNLGPNVQGTFVASLAQSTDRGVITVTGSPTTTLKDNLFFNGAGISTYAMYIKYSAADGGTHCGTTSVPAACTGAGGAGTYAINPEANTVGNLASETMTAFLRPTLALQQLGPTTIYNDQAGDPAALTFEGTTNTNQQCLLGYDTTNNAGSFECLVQGGSASPIMLNQHGGGVGIGLATTTSISGFGLVVSGKIKATGVFNDNGTDGVTCATGSPTSSFAAVGGIVTHC